MAVHGAYLSSGSGSTLPSPGALVPELSRRARGFVVWAALRQLGRSGVDGLVTRCCAHARALARAFAIVPGLSVLNDVVFNQVVVRPEPPGGVAPDVFVPRLVVAIQREGTCFPTPSVWRGTPALRFAVSNADTTAVDIERSAAAVARVYAGLLG
jgi:glutamate/tyrosine decarboxylase-like PLP-dependent enzyme